MTKAATAPVASNLITVDLTVAPPKDLMSSELLEKYTDKKNNNLVF